MANRQTRSRKRRQQKRNRIIFTLLFTALTVFAVNGLMGLITGRGVKTEGNSQIVGSQPQETPLPTPTPNPIPQPNDFTLLVNRENPLSDDYQVETRNIVNNGVTTDFKFDVRAVEHLEAMLKDAADAGHPVLIRSAHRTINYQKMLYNNKVQAYLNAGYSQQAAQTEAAKWVAVPGTSEHNLGIVVDIVNQGYTGELEQYFEEQPLFDWLVENCADYGFILRYPKTKESVTGIVYEPWHYRYVGREVAHYIMDNDLTLEEYWEEVKQNG
ncbi:MAG: M15 family metallopeptidase [Oscillospiraceae bacterium]|nr:M15 family metallopeptidase [Oscillospiraceae bacterium]